MRANVMRHEAAKRLPRDKSRRLAPAFIVRVQRDAEIPPFIRGRARAKALQLFHTTV